MRYVLLCREEAPDSDDLRRIANTPGVKILTHSVPHALLVEASPEAIDKLRPNLKNWSISEQVTYSRPSYPLSKIPREKKGQEDPR